MQARSRETDEAAHSIQVGDWVRGTPYNTRYEVIGRVACILPETEKCNCIIVFITPSDADTDTGEPTGTNGAAQGDPIVNHTWGLVVRDMSSGQKRLWTLKEGYVDITELQFIMPGSHRGAVGQRNAHRAARANIVPAGRAQRKSRAVSPASDSNAGET